MNLDHNENFLYTKTTLMLVLTDFKNLQGDLHCHGRKRPSTPVLPLCILVILAWKFSEKEFSLDHEDWLIDSSLIDRLIDWLTDRLIGWLIDWLIDWFVIDWLIDWLVDWLIEWPLIGESNVVIFENLRTVLKKLCSCSLARLMQSCSNELTVKFSNPKMSKMPIVKGVAGRASVGARAWFMRKISQPNSRLYKAFAMESRQSVFNTKQTTGVNNYTI